jgi:hypothetical protein
MKTKKFNLINIATFVLFAICMFTFSGIIAQTTPSLQGLQSGLQSQYSTFKTIAGIVCSMVFVAGVIHVIIAFTNHSQNLKNIVMAYVGGFIFFAVVWALL